MYNSNTDKPKAPNSTKIISVDEGFYSVSLGNTNVGEMWINLEKRKVSSESKAK